MNRHGNAAPWPLWLRLMVVVLAGAALAAPFLVWGDELARVFANREQIVEEIRRAGAWGPLVVIGLSVAQTIVAPVPGQAVNFVAGYLYGPWAGIAYSWIGLVLGTAFTMALARFAGRPAVERLVSPALLARMDRAAAQKGLGFFFLVFLSPGLPDDVLAFVAGLTPCRCDCCCPSPRWPASPASPDRSCSARTRSASHRRGGRRSPCSPPSHCCSRGATARRSGRRAGSQKVASRRTSRPATGELRCKPPKPQKEAEQADGSRFHRVSDRAW